MAVAGFDGLEQLGDRLALVAARAIAGFELVGHSTQYASGKEPAQRGAVRDLL